MARRRGTQRPTLADVAAAVGVSAISVSRWFNTPARVSPALALRIAAAVDALGYVPNRFAGGLASAHNRVVAMVVPNLSGPIYAPTLQALSDALAQHDYQLLLASSNFSPDDEARAVRAFLGWSPAALVLTSHAHTEATERLIAQLNIPVVETWDLQPARRPLQVGFSHAQVGRDAATYLLGKGYRRIVYVHNSVAGDHSARARCAGYEAVMAEHGLPARSHVPSAPTPMEAGAQALHLLARERRARRPEALIFANDNLACGALLAGQRHGIPMPADMALLGFGDYAFADKLLPSLSTIRPPAHEIGTVTARLLLQLVGAATDDAPVPHDTELRCALVARESA